MKNLTITAASQKLAAKGIELVRVMPYDLQARTARYEICENGELRIATAKEINTLAQ